MARKIYEGTQTHTNKITSWNSDAINIEGATDISYLQSIDDNTPAAKDFAAGRVDTTTFTYDTKANTGNGDYAVVKDTTGASWAIALSKEIKEAGTTTFPDKATIASKDHIIYTDAVETGVKND